MRFKVIMFALIAGTAALMYFGADLRAQVEQRAETSQEPEGPRVLNGGGGGSFRSAPPVR